MLKKLLVALIASAFAMSAYAQAPKAEPKGQTGTTTQPATPPSAKGDSSSARADSKMEPRKDGKVKKAKTKTAKASKTSKAKNDDAKDSRKDATAAPKKDVK